MDIMETIETAMGFIKPDDLAELAARSVKGKEAKFTELFVKAISRMECYENGIHIINAGYIENQLKLKLNHLMDGLKHEEANP